MPPATAYRAGRPLLALNRQVRLLDFGAAKSLISDRSRSMASVFEKGYAPYDNAPTSASAGSSFMTRTYFEDVDGDARRLIVRPLTGSGTFRRSS